MGMVVFDVVLYGNDVCGDKVFVNDVVGKVVVILCGICGFIDKVKVVIKCGVVVVLFINNDSFLGVIWGVCDDICKLVIFVLLFNKEGIQFVGVL